MGNKRRRARMQALANVSVAAMDLTRGSVAGQARHLTVPPPRIKLGIRRNAMCPCGSGKKFKACCLDLIVWCDRAPPQVHVVMTRPTSVPYADVTEALPGTEGDRLYDPVD